MRPTSGAGLADWLGTVAALLLITVASFGCGSDCADAEKFEGDPCTLAAGEEGVCRRADACGWLRHALVTRILTKEAIVRCGFDRDELIVCCRQDGSTPTRAGTRAAVDACGNYDGLHSSLAFHILQGTEAEVGDVPFIGALGYPQENPEPAEAQYIWGCGSSLIAPRFLLTAAHCITSYMGQPQVVRMGTLNLLVPAKPDEVQTRMVKNVVLHPKYKPGRKYDDIALIEVDSPFLFGDDTVKPACLSTTLEDLDETEYLLAAGWGQTETRSNSPDTLFLANLTTVPVDKCQQPYESLKLGKRNHLPNGILPSQYCAIGVRVGDLDRMDTCEGDSGGPLYYVAGSDNMQKYYLLGITSFGLNCGSTLPSIYTRVAHYLDWIESHVWPDGEAAT